MSSLTRPLGSSMPTLVLQIYSFKSDLTRTLKLTVPCEAVCVREVVAHLEETFDLLISMRWRV